MCVRYTLHKPEAALSSVTRALKADLAPAEWLKPRFNVALTSEVPIVMQAGDLPVLERARWGYPRIEYSNGGGPHANAKSETARELRTFAAAARSRRCLVPANGFYEWQSRDNRKWPFLFTLSGHESFCFAGLWIDSDQERQFCFLTTAANPDMAGIHDRMPVLLHGDGCAAWLSPDALGNKIWEDLTRTPPAGTLSAVAVDTFVSSTRNEGPRCHEPLIMNASQLELL